MLKVQSICEAEVEEGKISGHNKTIEAEIVNEMTTGIVVTEESLQEQLNELKEAYASSNIDLLLAIDNIKVKLGILVKDLSNDYNYDSLDSDNDGDDDEEEVMDGQQKQDNTDITNVQRIRIDDNEEYVNVDNNVFL